MLRQIIPIFLTSSALAQPLLVENGQPRAEIIISDKPTRMQRVSAHEFRQQIEKISGAKLPIVTQPSGSAVKVFIGASAHSPVKADGLKDGAYRLASGADWLALIGDDADFEPVGPFARHNGDIPRAQAEWEKIVAAPYGLPAPGLYKHRTKVTLDGETLELCGLDERGSFNAVTAFLQRLGARWYLPGELGEVLPSLKTIELPKLDETVRPDFALRQFNFRFATCGPDSALWVMRLGIRNDERLQIAHGMANMTNREEVFAHPEWFAIYGGKPDFKPGDSKCQLCYSNDELFRETVRYARALLDTFQLESVSIMPPDGYTSICQCEKCQGKDSPERNERGLLSDYVWDFVNRVAKEVGKTHPKAKILNCAYGVYTLPPLKIDQLQPNVLVGIVGGRRPMNKADNKTEGEAAPDMLRAAWAKKTANPIINFENYPFTDRGWYLPAFVAQSMGDTVISTKGMSQGEDIWLTVRQDFDKVATGFNHFLVYFTARAYWPGYEPAVALREYCRLFYGPAETEMLSFFTFCEANWKVMDEDKAKADESLALFDKAKAKADAESVFGKRLVLIDDFLKGLRMKSQQLGQKRGPVPTVRLVGDAKGVVIDGKLDDEYWQNCPVAATGKFRELQTGRVPTFGTSFKAGWQGSNLVFAIRCDERHSEKLNIAATREDDQAIWYGDAIEIELATETHSYYQIAISPNGHVVDLDRGAPRSQWFGWDSKAEVATHIADDHWTVEISLPVTTDENDPLHQIIGRHPTQSLPWHINLCRQRIREDGQELSALSPTGTEGFHEPMKFAHFYDGRSHQFDADPTVTDFVIAYRDATQKRQPEPFHALATGKLNDFQKSAALEQAALLDKKATFIDQIPIEAVKKTAQMQNLLANFNATEVVKQFAAEDITKWPFWKRGDGFHARGRAYSIAKNGEKAETDLRAALDFIGDLRTRETVLLVLAQNRETNLKDDPKALEAYQAILEGKTRLGGADEYSALQGIARIQTRRGQFDDALKTLNRAEPEKLQGIWKTHFIKSIEEVQKALK
jgi:tetratricopeptide (TPR) repeat protein